MMNSTTGSPSIGQTLHPVQKDPVIYTPASSDAFEQSPINMPLPRSSHWDLYQPPYASQGWSGPFPASYVLPPLSPYFRNRYTLPASPRARGFPIPQPQQESYRTDEFSNSYPSHVPYYSATHLVGRAMPYTKAASPYQSTINKASSSDWNKIDTPDSKQSRQNNAVKENSQTNWDLNSDEAEDVGVPIPDSVNVFTGEETIIVNGIRYVRAKDLSQEGPASSNFEKSQSEVLHEDGELTGTRSEPLDNGEGSNEDCGGWNKACSHVEDWTNNSNDLVHQAEVPSEEICLCPVTDDGGGWCNTIEAGEEEYEPQRGTLDNPYRRHSDFDEKPVRVLVGINAFHEHKVGRSVMKEILSAEGYYNPMDELDDGRTLVYSELSSESFEKLVECVSAGYPLDRDFEVLRMFSLFDLLALYPATRVFYFYRLASAILRQIEEFHNPHDFFAQAQDFYREQKPDMEFRNFVRTQIAHFLDLMGTSNDASGNGCAAVAIKAALLNPNSSACLRQDVMDVILDREIDRNLTKNKRIPSQNQAEVSDDTSDAESVLSSHYSSERSVYEAEVESAPTSTKDQSGRSALAIKDSDDQLCSIQFKVGDRIYDLGVAPSRDWPESTAVGTCDGMTGFLPYSYVESEPSREDGW